MHKEIPMPTVLLAGTHDHQSPDAVATLAAFQGALPDWRIVTVNCERALPPGTSESGAVRVRDRRSLGRAVLNADAVVFAGGTVFTTLPPWAGRSTHDLLTWALLLAGGAQAAGRPVAMLGVGADRLPDARARWLARALVRRADLLVLCDEESAHTLAEVGAPAPFRVGADPVWTLVDQASVGPRDRDGVVVVLDHVPGGGNLADRLATALGPVVASGMKVELQPGRGDTTGGSSTLASAVAIRLDGRVEVTAPPASILDARMRIAAARLAVCLSSHAMIAAAAAGTPLVGIAHQLKLIGLARRLEQPAVPITADPATIATTVLSSVDAQPASPHAVHAEIARAAEGFRLLRLLFTRGTLAELDSFNGLSLMPAPWIVR
jgi:polysaccharide pyruvyl transferase WcaK-like protein